MLRGKQAAAGQTTNTSVNRTDRRRPESPSRLQAHGPGARTLLLLAAGCMLLSAAALPLDAASLEFLRNLAPHHSYMRRVFKLPAHLFRWWTFVALGIVLLSQARRRQLLTGFFATVVTANFAVHALKFVTGRPRPNVEAPAALDPLHFDWFGDPQAGLDSFPSGHATMTVLLLVLLSFYVGRWWWLLLPPAILTCLSRVAIEQHYLSDVLAGAGVAFGVGGACLGRLGPDCFRRLTRPGRQRYGPAAARAPAARADESTVRR